MKPFALAISICLLSAAPVFAGWTWLNPRPQGNNLTDIVFLDRTTAIAVGQNASIVITRDGGASWSTATPPDDVHLPLAGVAAINATTAVAAGDGFLLTTTDAGRNWTVISGTPAQPGAIDFLGNVGLIASPAGLHRSGDGGRTWSLVRAGSVNGVSIAGPLVAFACTNSSLLRSENAGLDWASLPGAPGGLGVSFSGPHNGATFAGDVRVTHDGGATWTHHALPSLFKSELTSARMVDATTLMISGSYQYRDPDNPRDITIRGRLLLSTDEGVTWTGFDGPQPLVALAVNPARVVLVCGEAGSVHRLAPPGSWSQLAGNTFPAMPAGASAFADPMHGIVSASLPGSAFDRDDRTTLLRTSDGGQTWQNGELPEVKINDFAFANGSRTVYAVGRQLLIDGTRQGIVLKSNDGGASWLAIAADPSIGELQSIEFSSPNHGVAVGIGSFVLVDDDHVTTGLLPEDYVFTYRDVAFADKQTAVAVGGYRFADYGNIAARSTDGGATWERVVFGLGPHIRSVAFPTRGTGFISVDGTIIRSDDGGTTWNEAVAESPGIIYAMEFATPQYGVAVGEWSGTSATALETTDGGRHWSEVPIAPSTTALTSVSCVAPFHAIAAGTELVVLDYAGSRERGTPNRSTIITAQPGFELLPNQPNPFNPITTIPFVLPAAGHVRLAIYDVAGRHVVTLVDDMMEAGTHAVRWNGTDQNGSRVASGVYLSRLEGGSASATRKIVLLK